MDNEILIVILSLVGIIGYIILFFGTKEPRHRHGNLLIALYGVCLIILVVAGLFVQWHVEFWWQELTSFFAVYGFIAFVFLIYTAKVLRPMLQREEDYYEKSGVKNK
jgi:hypothetical protein